MCQWPCWGGVHHAGIHCAGVVHVMQCGVCCAGVVFVCAGCAGVLVFIIWVWHVGVVFVVVASVVVASVMVASMVVASVVVSVVAASVVVSVVAASVVVSMVVVSVIVVFVVLALCSWWCLPLVLMAHITISNTVKLNVSNLFGMCSMHLSCFCKFIKP